MFKARKRLKWTCVFLICIVFGVLVGYYFGDLLKVREDMDYRRTAEVIFNDVLREIEKVRGLHLRDRVELEIVEVSWVKENWGRRQVEAASREIETEERILKALFLIPENVSLTEIKVQQAGSITAASFEGRVYIVKNNFNPYDEPTAKEIFAHELTHILQGRHFKTPERKSHDGKQAWSALIEGDAELTVKKYVKTETYPKKGSVLPLAQEPSFSYTYSLETQDPMTEIWLFPYQYGENFAEALYVNGGWERINQAYENPPQTTEQIMHPEKYLKGEQFDEAEAPPLNVSGFINEKTERLGEHFILVMLGTHIPREKSKIAAEGWNGDSFTYYEGEDDYLYTWKILWDTMEDAKQFSSAFKDMMNAVGVRMENNFWEAGRLYIKFEKEELSTLIVGSTITSQEITAMDSGDENPIFNVFLTAKDSF